jgi:hypothetical protein
VQWGNLLRGPVAFNEERNDSSGVNFVDVGFIQVNRKIQS